MNPLTPLTIGRFRIEQGIGRGGMGIVYRAYDTVLARPVALKLLGAHLNDDEQALARFRREAATLMRLKHSHIALVYDFGEHEGRPYIAMEWVEGRTLKSMLQEEGRFSLTRSLAIIAQLADALDYAHRHGVVHRDVKPANILIDEKDHATLVDFGVAWWEEAPSLTTTGSIVGTPLYMAPEQLLGQPVDGRADLYSLAIILYEMLAGRPPFGGQDASAPAIIQQQLYLPPPPLDEVQPAIPRSVAAVIEKALSKLPDDRFPSGDAFVRALTEAAAPAPVVRKKPSLVLAAAGLLLILLAGLGLWRALAPPQTAATPSPSISPTPPPTTLPTPTLELPALPLAEPDWGEWTGPHGDARQIRFVETELYPLAVKPRWRFQAQTPLTQPALAGEGAIYLAQGPRVQLLNWTTGAPEDIAPSLGAAITAPLSLGLTETLTLYAATADNQLYAFDGYEMRLLWRLGEDALDGETIIQQTVGEDGILIAATENGRVLRLDAEGNVRFALTLEKDAVLAQPPTVTPTGMFGVTDNAALVAIDPDAGQIVWNAPLNAFPTTPAISLEGYGGVAVGDEEGVVEARSALSGERRWQAELEGAVTGMAFNGDILAVSTDAGGLYALSPADGQTLWRQPTPAPLLAPIITPTWVLTLAQDGSVRAYAAEDGEPWPEAQADLGMRPEFPPILVGGWLYVQNQQGVWAFGPRFPEAP